MIVPEDCEFHDRDPSIRNWAETIGATFSVPEAGILANVYVLARPNIGVAIACVEVHQGFCSQPYEIDFHDPQMHLACPESFTDFTLANGLSVEVTKPPVDYRFRYESETGGCRFEFAFRGVMPAWDMHDPAENPLVAQSNGHEAGGGLGDAWATGHFDLLGHVTGELELRGRTYAIDAYAGMDHSWGPRAELGTKAITYLHVPFGDAFGLHLTTSMDFEDGDVVHRPFRFGYLHEHGDVVGLVDASVETERVDMLPVANRIRATDARGREYEWFGTAVGAAPWYSWNPCYVSFSSLMRYHDPDRGVGHCMHADVWGLDYLARGASRHGRRAGAAQRP